MSDLISRQAAIDAIKDEKTKRGGYLTSPYVGYEIAEEVVAKLPSVQPERKNGRWEMIPDPFCFFGEIPVCSECGCTTKMRDKAKFCPHCGAQMEGQ